MTAPEFSRPKNAVTAERTGAQRKTFTKWINAQFMRGRDGTRVEDLVADLKTGVRFIKLLSVLCPHLAVPRYNQSPKLQLHEIENLNLAFDMLKEAQIKVVGIGADNVAEGDEMRILGLIWSIIYAVNIGTITVESEGEKIKSGKEGLLLWCQRQVAGYAGVAVTDFTSSWRNGLALAALIHKNRPDVLDYEAVKSKDGPTIVQECFSVASSELGVPSILEVSDLVEGSDDKVILCYISQFFSVFSKQSTVQDATRRVKTFVQRQMDFAKKSAEYEKETQAFVTWIEKAKGMHGERQDKTYAADLEKAVQRLARVEHFRKEEARPQYAKAQSLVAKYDNLVDCLKMHGRTPYVPPAGVPTGPQITEMWEDIEKCGRLFLSRVQTHYKEVKAQAETEYVTLARSLNEFFKTRMQLLSTPTEQLEGQLQKLQVIEKEVQDQEDYKKAEALVALFSRCGIAEKDIADGSHRWDELQWSMDQLRNTVTQKRIFLEDCISSKAAEQSISQEKTQEYHDTFARFDTNKNKILALDEFMACCVGLGIDGTEAEYSSHFKQYAANPDQGLSFDEFINFMLQLALDTQSLTQVKESFSTLAKSKGDVILAAELQPVGEDALSFCSTNMMAKDGGLDYKGYIQQVFLH